MSCWAWILAGAVVLGIVFLIGGTAEVPGVSEPRRYVRKGRIWKR